MEPEQTNPQIPQPTQAPASVPVPMWKTILEKVKIIGINLFKRFYANKKIFWPVSISFGLIFLVLIIGIIFGGKKAQPKPIITPSPSPFVQVTPLPSPTEPLLKDAGDKLIDLKTKINDWDPKQSKLQPLKLNFEVRF